jgi:ATP adenylyltransferase
MDHLWSPWRLEYVTGAKPKTGCVFCLEQAPRSESDPLIVFQGRAAYVILNFYPYNNGHLLVVPYRHEPTIAGLTSEEMNEMGQLTQRCETVLCDAYKLDGINMGVNLGRTAGAGIVEHVHLHVVPRWHGDTNFMTVVGQTRVLPEKLESTAARLRPLFHRFVDEIP